MRQSVWLVKSSHVRKINVAEMRMLRLVCGHTKRDKIRNKAMQEKVVVLSVVDN